MLTEDYVWRLKKLCVVYRNIVGAAYVVYRNDVYVAYVTILPHEQFTILTSTKVFH